ncbi:hypothetical protein EE612_007242 [Oryza sativa]|nr:hypothetical protein EE612_007242 [Oryza sativa]
MADLPCIYIRVVRTLAFPTLANQIEGEIKSRTERDHGEVDLSSPEEAMSRAECGGGEEEERCRYRGVRRRRWGKWVSEIRVPGTRERLWLGSYATPEAAAVAHDTAVYFLRGGAGDGGGGGATLNFPERAAATYGGGAAVARLSPRSVQRVASDAGMAADAQLVAARDAAPPAPATAYARPDHCAGATTARHDELARRGMYGAHAHAAGANARTSGERQLVCAEEISVDDMEILM